MELSIVILNWNAGLDTIKCVTQISRWKHIKTNIIVVDNASNDNSVEVIQQECPDIHLICNEENQGFAGGTNRGVEKALHLGDAPILLINNDAFLGEEDAGIMLDVLEQHPEIGFLVPLLYDGDSPDQLISAGSKNPVKHHQTQIKVIPPKNPEIFRVEVVSGTVVIIRAEVFRVAGLLDEDFFFSTEVADFCVRAAQYSFRCAVSTKAKAYHTINRSSALRNNLYVYYIIRNRFIFIKNAPYRFKLHLYSFWTIYSLALSTKLYITGNFVTAKAVKMGLYDAVRKRLGGQNERVLTACNLFSQPRARF